MGFLREVNKVFADDSANTMHGSVDALNLAKAPRLHDHPNHRLIDDRSGATTLGDQNFSRRDCEFLDQAWF